MTTTLKVLLIEKDLFHYRIPFFNKLASKVGNLTICHSGNSLNTEMKFSELILPKRKFFRFILQPGLRSLAKQYDVVITKYDISWLSMMFLSLIPGRSFKLIRWGIGVSTEKGYDKVQLFDRIKFFFAKKSDALIFYSSWPIEKYISGGIPPDKLFVAHNSVSVAYSGYEKKEGQYFIFVGSLHERKNIEEILRAIWILKKRDIMVDFKIIGDGYHKDRLIELVNRLGISSQVDFVGSIRGSDLGDYFTHAIAAVSPGQAGLSVLESMAYGVPFISKSDAITGGELFNIIDGYNGYYYIGDELVLADLMERLFSNPDMQRQLSLNAMEHYIRNRTVEHMVDVFMDAIEYVNRQA